MSWCSTPSAAIATGHRRADRRARGAPCSTTTRAAQLRPRRDTFRHPWVLMLDADERVPNERRREMLAAVTAADARPRCSACAARITCSAAGFAAAAVIPPGSGASCARHGHVERAINEEYHADGARQARAHLHHFPFNKGFAAWIEKHDRYSTMEAELRLAGQRDRTHRRLFSRDACNGAARSSRRCIACPGGR